MRKQRYIIIFIIAAAIPLLFGGKIVVGGAESVYAAYMMGGEMEGSYMMGEHTMKRGMGMMAMPMMHPGRYFTDRLDLTKEQADKFRRLHIEYRKETLRRKVEIEIAEMDLIELLRISKSDEKEIEKRLGKLEALKSDLNTYRIKTLLKTRDFLTDEQYENLSSFILGWMRPFMMKGGAGGWYMHGPTEDR